jgi:hypothetical protein
MNENHKATPESAPEDVVCQFQFYPHIINPSIGGRLNGQEESLIIRR